MAGKWRTVRIEDVAECVAMGAFGSSIKVETFVSKGIPIISGRHLHGWRVDDNAPFNFITPEHAEILRHANVRRGDVIFTRTGTIGQVSYVPRTSAYDRYVLSQRQFYLRPNFNKVLPEYLVAYFRSPEGQRTLLANASHVGVPSIVQSVTYLRSIDIPLPPLPEQYAIAHILGTLNDKIDLNRKQNETLEAMARALFKAWFVDFEPVRAKREGRWQRGQSLPGLPARLYDLFPDHLVESEIGPIPTGWKVGTLGNVAENPRRSIPPNSIPPDTPYIALEHMPRRCVALSDWSTAEGIESNKFEFEKGEILFGKLRPYFHKVGVAPVDGVCSTDIVVVRPRVPHWFAFVLCVVSSDDFVGFTNANSTGTKMPRTSWTDMARYEIALPPDALAHAFNGIVRQQADRLISAVHESRTLAQLRDTLLPKLISGALRIQDAEAFLKERGA